ncbi:MAG TPA: hypothetical protein VI461_12495 [Chitinophagaceae bacterium]|nr:hypothetical protein [Chitinophagaceae bacterium]
MTTQSLRKKFNSILGHLNSGSTTNFCNKVEAAFEALTLAHIMQEYSRIHGNANKVSQPTHPHFLNQKPGRFTTERAFEVTFKDGNEFYFATDVEVWGLNAYQANGRRGIKFEADVVVIRTEYAADIDMNFDGYPAPQHLDCLCECKFGKYNKGQLREMLGLRRHVSYLKNNGATSTQDPAALYQMAVNNTFPVIPLFMARPKSLAFFDNDTAGLYDLKQVVIK